MVRAIPTRMLYTLIIHLWIPPCDSSNGLRNLYYYITGRFFTSRALGNASACPSPPAPLGDLYQIVIKIIQLNLQGKSPQEIANLCNLRAEEVVKYLEALSSLPKSET